MSTDEEAALAQRATERRLLGYVVASGTIPAPGRVLPANSFLAPEHVTAWEILTEIADRDQPITPDAVVTVARQRDALARLPGGHQWPTDVAKEACLAQVFPQLVEIVTAAAGKRALARAAVECQARIERGAALDDVVSDLETATARARDAMDGDWPAPSPLVARVEPETFPVDALPDCIRGAVMEVQAFVQAPVSMVAMSAIGAASVAVQALVDVQRAEGLKGPVGLFLMCIAPSGERKTTCDAFFTKPVRTYELAAIQQAQPLVADHRAALSAWEAQKRGLLAKIEASTKADRDVEKQKAALRDLMADEPMAPRVPKLLYSDATPEALASGLANRWPSSAVVSSEAGSVFGSHGMGKESIMRNLALLNQLWDGVPIQFDRRTSEGFIVRNARLTVGLQVQEETLREFLRTDDGLARGMGFLARMLLGYPESTQGRRLFREPPSTWPALTKFRSRIAEVLAVEVPIDDQGALTPATLTLSPEAKASWIEFHDAIEADLSASGKFCDVRDVASKTADNAARLAAIFHVIEHGVPGHIAPNTLRAGTRIAAWHLHEARRFLGEFAMPREFADAARLDAWLVDYCKREHTCSVPASAVQKTGPGRLRPKAAMQGGRVLPHLHGEYVQ